MATTLSAQITIHIEGTLAETTGYSAASIPHLFQPPFTTLASTDITLAYTEGGTISGGSNSIDLNGGTITDVLGNTLTFDTIHMITFQNDSTSNDMTVTIADIDTGDNDMILIVPAGGFATWGAPSGCASGVGDITITGTNDDTYKILVLGDSA